MDLLAKIIAEKKAEIQVKRNCLPLSELIRQPLFNHPVKSLSAAVRNGNGIIAEFKRKSPSGGSLLNEISIEEVIQQYIENGVSGFSVLTDKVYFGGDLTDLETAKKMGAGPVLRKDFIVDEYQVFEAKAHGADAILLIAEALDEYHCRYLTTIAHTIGLEVVMEVHAEESLAKLNENVDVIGVNNRNLKTLKTSLEQSADLIRKLPYEAVKISESGIQAAEDIRELIQLGFDGFLIGETLLKAPGLLPEFVAVSNHTKFSYVR